MSWISFLKKWNRIEHPVISANESKLFPESKWLVSFDDKEISTSDYQKQEISLSWNEITKIVIDTNDSGPWGTDLWWKILSHDKLILIPNGATGENDIIERFQSLPGFDNENMIKARRSTGKAEFIVWESDTFHK